MLLAILATPTYGGGEHLCLACSESDHLNKKPPIILTVASKHFGHMTFYAADVKSGSIRHKIGKKFYRLY